MARGFQVKTPYKRSASFEVVGTSGTFRRIVVDTSKYGIYARDIIRPGVSEPKALMVHRKLKSRPKSKDNSHKNYHRAGGSNSQDRDNADGVKSAPSSTGPVNRHERCFQSGQYIWNENLSKNYGYIAMKRNKPKKTTRHAGRKLQLDYGTKTESDRYLHMQQGQTEGQPYKTTYKNGVKPVAGQEEPDWVLMNEFRAWLQFTQMAKNQQTDVPKGHGSRSPAGAKARRPAATKGKNGLKDVGPHEDLYRQFNHIRLELDKKEEATLAVQKYVRGFLARAKMKELQDRVLLRHAGNWEKFVRDYKGLVTRIQKRYYVTSPQTPFCIEDVNKFLDRKEKYEKIFFDMAIGDKLPRHLLRRYFNECGLNPTEKELNIGYHAVFRGCSSKAEIVFVVDCSSSLGEENFRIQSDFVKEVVDCLHVSEDNVRVGYVPYNTDVFESFGLEQYDCRADVIKGIERVKYKKGITRTDLALKRMREIFKTARSDVPKTAILITDGASYASYATEKQADLARKEDITLLAVGVGTSVERKEIYMIAKDRGHVFFLENHNQLPVMKSELLRDGNFTNCKYCREFFTSDLETDALRGLQKDEALEVIWMVYPPKATGLDPLRRTRWMSSEENGTNFIDQDDSAYSTCLKFIIQAKLDKESGSMRPAASRRRSVSKQARQVSGLQMTNGEGLWEKGIDKAMNYVSDQKQKELNKKKADKSKTDKQKSGVKNK